MIFFRESKTPIATLSPLHIRIDIKLLVDQEKEQDTNFEFNEGYQKTCTS
jgi:hypothetical protein